MPLYEVETTAHIFITWANDEAAAREVVRDAYPHDEILRFTKRPRDCWVISKAALGLTSSKLDPCTISRQRGVEFFCLNPDPASFEIENKITLAHAKDSHRRNIRAFETCGSHLGGHGFAHF